MKYLENPANRSLLLGYTAAPFRLPDMRKIFFTAVVCLTNCVMDCRPNSDQFSEELYIKPMRSGHVYTYFQFTTVWNVSGDTSETYQHSHLFPRALGEIVGGHNIQELHLSLTAGVWRYDTWGYPVYDASPGAELWAWFKKDTEDIDTVWKHLAHTLSGLLCASLNFIDDSNTFSPQLSFRPTGTLENPMINSSLVRYASLPREIVCTENLTPWKKLLPCDSVKGLASLLNAGHIYNTNYHSLGLHVRPVCQDRYCSVLAVEIRQIVSLVFDLKILDRQSEDWSLRKLFGLGLAGACPLATISNIYVDGTLNKTGTVFRMQPDPQRIVTDPEVDPDSIIYLYDVKEMNPGRMINIAATYNLPKPFTVKPKTTLYAERYLVGLGQERGTIVTKIFNNHWKALDIIFLDNIPWFLPVYVHTLQITSSGKEIVPTSRKFLPGKERSRPYYLEVLFRAPERSVTEIKIQFDYVFLKWQEYPPDANHGFYIGSAVISAQLPIGKNTISIPPDHNTILSSLNAARDESFVQIRTDIIIITLPTPDFSMPYNVICLACTVVALAFGPLHNITTKRLCLKDTTKPKGLSRIARFKLYWKKETAAE